MKTLNLLLFLLLASLPALAVTGQATLTWTQPATNVNGTPISNAVTYNVYQGAQGATLVKVQSGISAHTAVVTTGLTPGTTQCFAVTAVVNNVESAQSNTACAAVSFPVPGAPTQIVVVIS